MKDISSNREFIYYKTMYRRAVTLLVTLSISLLLLTFFLFYAYATQPDRHFYASAESYKITKIKPLSYG